MRKGKLGGGGSKREMETIGDEGKRECGRKGAKHDRGRVFVFLWLLGDSISDSPLLDVSHIQVLCVGALNGT